jgi:hypothetical protein
LAGNPFASLKKTSFFFPLLNKQGKGEQINIKEEKMGWISKIIKFKIITEIGKKLFHIGKNRKAVKRGSPVRSNKKVKHAY